MAQKNGERSEISGYSPFCLTKRYHSRAVYFKSFTATLLIFSGDLRDRLIRPGAELPAVTSTASAPTETEQPQATITAKGFNLNFRDLIEQRNAFLMEWVRSQNENIAESPIFQMLTSTQSNLTQFQK